MYLASVSTTNFLHHINRYSFASKALFNPKSSLFGCENLASLSFNVMEPNFMYVSFFFLSVCHFLIYNIQQLSMMYQLPKPLYHWIYNRYFLMALHFQMYFLSFSLILFVPDPKQMVCLCVIIYLKVWLILQNLL